MVCWVRRPTGSWEGVIPGSFRMCGLWVRVGLGPGFAHGRSTVGRNVREAETGCRGPRRTPLVRWPLPMSAGRCGPVASTGRAGGVRLAAVPSRHIGGGNPGGRDLCGTRPPLFIRWLVRANWPCRIGSSDATPLAGSQQSRPGERRARLGLFLALQPPGQLAVGDVGVRLVLDDEAREDRRLVAVELRGARSTNHGRHGWVPFEFMG